MKHHYANPLKPCGLFILVLLAVVAIQAQDSQLPDLVKRVKPSVVVVTTYDAKGKPLASGSGFCPSPGIVATNHHVIDGASRIVVTLADGKVHTVRRVLALDEDDDVAILQVELRAADLLPISLTNVLPEEGERIFVISSPRGLRGTISDGIVSSVRTFRNGRSLLQMTAAISPGSSGGPVINLRGQVVGMAVGAREDGQSLNFVVPSASIDRFLRVALDRTIRSDFSGSSSTTLNTPSVNAPGAVGVGVPAPPPPVSIRERTAAESNRLIVEGQRFIKSKTQDDRFGGTVSNSDLEAAIQIFKAATTADPKSYKAWLELGRTQFRRYDKDDAVSAGWQEEAGISLGRAVELAPSEPETYYELSRVLAWMKKSEQALALCRELIGRLPRSAAGYVCAGRVYHHTEYYGRKAERISWFTQAAQREPNNAEILSELAASYESSKRHSEAITTYRRALKADSSRVDVYESLADILKDLGNHTEAISVARQLIALKPEIDNGYRLAAGVYVSRKKYTEAIKASKKAISISPDNPTNHLFIAQAYEGAGRYGEAAAAYIEEIRLGKDDFFVTYRYQWLGDFYVRAKHYDLAIAAFNESIRRDPERPDCYAELGNIYFNQDKYEKAAGFYRKAIALAKDSSKRFAYANYNLALIYLRSEDRASAFEEYKKLKELDRYWADELLNIIYPK